VPATKQDIQSAEELRRQISSGEWTGHTSGLLPGRQQANLAIIPRDAALDFAIFCARNPKACPVIAVSDPGDPMIRFGTTVADIRSCISKYRVWQDGTLVAEPGDIGSHWRDDSVAFLLGCSFTFESALENAGIEFRTKTGEPAVYVTNVPTVSAGVFSGPLVVSMRPIKRNFVARAVEITGRYPKGHGAPVHIGNPDYLGIDLAHPDFGPQPDLADDDVPVFWACGVTPQAAIERAGLTYAIAHFPSSMFVFDHHVDEDPSALVQF
jgi:uncharacterized protein YcsI (UPF0317 family)